LARPLRRLNLGRPKELQFDRHRVERAAAANLLAQSGNIGALDQIDPCERRECRIEVGDVFARDFELKRRSIGRERQTVAIQDQSAVR
jgi:hypothetical protein